MTYVEFIALGTLFAMAVAAVGVCLWMAYILFGRGK